MDEPADHPPSGEPIPDVRADLDKDKRKRKPYVVPTLTIYGNLQQMTGTMGLSGNQDGGSGMKYKYTAP